MNRQIESLEREIAKIKRELVAPGDLQPGTLSRQEDAGGKPPCRCQASSPQKHGPRYPSRFARSGKSSSRSVRRQELAALQEQVRNHARLRDSAGRWIDLAAARSNLGLTAEPGKLSPAAGRPGRERQHRAP